MFSQKKKNSLFPVGKNNKLTNNDGEENINKLTENMQL